MVAAVALPNPDPDVTGDDVREAYRAAREAAVHALALLSQFDAQCGWKLEGAASPAHWLTANCALTHTEATQEVRNARMLRAHPEVDAALARGTITPSHLTVMSGIARHRSRRFRDDVAMLVDEARRTDPEHYRVLARRWRSQADDLLPAELRDEPNAVDLAQTYVGTWVINGVLDPVRGATLHTLLLERSAPIAADDHRTPSERRADALFAILTGDQPARATLDVHVDVDTLVGADRPIADVRCDLQGVGAIDRIVMQRLACSADVGRVLVRGASEVLDLGRRVRLASPAQRRAVVARDQGCVWPNCRRPAAMCEVHHLIPWQQGGASTVENLALLCSRHHTYTHEGWSITRTDAGTWEAVPP